MKSNVLYVVWNEHTLGYINPQFAPHMLGSLRASVLRGALFEHGPHILSMVDVKRRTLRPATVQDFEAYHVSLPPDFQQDQDFANAQLNQVMAAIEAAMKVPA